MFRAEVDMLGIPEGMVIVGLVLVLMTINLLLVRRINDIEPEVHSFRATSPVPPNRLLRAGLGLGFITLALAAIALPR